MSFESVSRWLQHQHESLPPDSLHSADAFPLATFSNPPSSSSFSERGINPAPPRDSTNVTNLLRHPPLMDEQDGTTQARRRSSSLAGAVVAVKSGGGKHRRKRSAGIIEGDERGSASDSDQSDSSKSDSTDFELDDMASDEGLEDDEETGLTRQDRQRRRRRKKNNTRLDQRIVEDDKYKKEEEKLANQSVLHSILINTLLVCLW